MTATAPVDGDVIYDAEALGSTPPPSDARLRKGKLLVVDDEPVIREVLGVMLKQLGYEPVCVEEGSKAITTFAKAYEMGQPFTGVILDLHNHVGLGGQVTLPKLLEIDPQVKAIVCSGDSDHPVMTHYQSYGFAGSLEKPFGVESLQQILQCLA
jgi:DNA-binding NtrC family response regulator